MKHKTAELTGPLLRRAVAMALGYKVEKEPHGTALRVWLDGNIAAPIDGTYCWAPDEEWEWGGPIIERERITIYPGAPDTGNWFAHIDPRARHWPGTTPLIAAMRAFVASKLGEEVELP
jgi:hypothetical protein